MADKKLLKHIIWVLLIVLAGFIVGGIYAYADIYFNKHKKNVKEKFVLYVNPGASYQEVLDSLDGRVIKLKSFEKAAKREDLANHLTPGRYEFTPQTTNIAMVRAIKYGYQSPMMVAISGYIRTPEILAKRLSSKFCADSLEFITQFSDPEFLDSLGVDSQNLLSLVIPDSYEMYWTTTPKEFMLRMQKEHSKFWTEERLHKAKEVGLTPKEVSVLASIVYCESKYVPEYGNIASVYLNRLKKGWRLCADPTVIFATGDFTINRVLRRHLATPSPYNTYLNEGLPPGPIAIPTKEAIDGVLNPSKTEYMFFCANPKFNGSHRFAKNGAEHMRNANDYRRALDSLLRARKAAEKQAAK